MPEPLVSVFLPTHARFKSGLLQKSVESVLAQKYTNFEFLIVDDASSDGTAEYLRQIAEKDKRITYIRHEQNVGLLAATLAQAYLQAKGDFIAFAFDDTEWRPHHLETLLKCLEENSMAAMVYGGVSVEPPGTAPMLLGHKEFDWHKLAEDNYIGHSGVLLRRNTIEKIGWLDPNIIVKRTCDWDLWLRIGKELQVIYCPEIVAAEKGVVQPDSLGMSVTRYELLTRKYQETGRDHLLTPEAVAANKTPRFEIFAWMDKEEKNQLRLLCFEHFVRTGELHQAIKTARQWMQERTGDKSDRLQKSDMEILVEAFNIYIAETRFACKNTCSSAFKLNDLTDAYNQLKARNEQFYEARYSELKNDYDQLSNKYWKLEHEYQTLLRSFSWQITKPVREFRKAINRNN